MGDVLREQAQFMVRCGFDAFEPADGSTPEAVGRRPPSASATSISAPPTAATPAFVGAGRAEHGLTTIVGPAA